MAATVCVVIQLALLIFSRRSKLSPILCSLIVGALMGVCVVSAGASGLPVFAADYVVICAFIFFSPMEIGKKFSCAAVALVTSLLLCMVALGWFTHGVTWGTGTGL